MTNAFQSLSGLGQVADQYEAVLCDIWGVIHNGREPFREACEALERFKDRGPVVLISNSPKPSVIIPDTPAQLSRLGQNAMIGSMQD